MKAALVALVVMCTGGVLSQNNYPLNYICHPDSTIQVDNPSPALYYSASAYDIESLFACHVNGTNDTLGQIPTFNIYGCDKDAELAFTMSTRTSDHMGDGVIGGSHETYVLQCTELVQEGIIFQAELALTVQEPDPTNPAYAISSLPSVDVTFSLTNTIWSSDYSSTVDTAGVGTLLKWHIRGPTEYDLLPISCVAYGGTSVGGGTSKVLAVDGCTSDATLVSDFRSAYGPSNTETDEVYTDLYAFKFIGHEYITLACTVRACEDGSPNCVQNCTSSGRKRRESPFSRSDLKRFGELLKDNGRTAFNKETNTAPSVARGRGSTRPREQSGYVIKSIRITEWGSPASYAGGSWEVVMPCVLLSAAVHSMILFERH